MRGLLSGSFRALEHRGVWNSSSYPLSRGVGCVVCCVCSFYFPVQGFMLSESEVCVGGMAIIKTHWLKVKKKSLDLKMIFFNCFYYSVVSQPFIWETGTGIVRSLWRVRFSTSHQSFPILCPPPLTESWLSPHSLPSLSEWPREELFYYNKTPDMASLRGDQWQLLGPDPEGHLPLKNIVSSCKSHDNMRRDMLHGGIGAF